MPVGITDLAHSIRKNTAASAVPISLSRGQQLVCAALGHKSFASFQAAQAAERELQEFDRLTHVVPDYELLAARALELELDVPAKRLKFLMDAAFEERMPGTHVHKTFSDLAMHIQDEIEQLVIADDGVNDAMAGANYDGIDEVYIEDEVEPDQANLDEPLTVIIPGQVTLGIDTERPYSGHQVKFQVQITLERCGRRCFEEADIEMLGASLDQDWGDEDSAPIKTLAEALAGELNIDVADAEQLTDVEPVVNSGNSDEMVYGYTYDFTDNVAPELAAKLMANYGSLVLEVGPSFFEGVRGPDWPN